MKKTFEKRLAAFRVLLQWSTEIPEHVVDAIMSGNPELATADEISDACLALFHMKSDQYSWLEAKDSDAYQRVLQRALQKAQKDEDDAMDKFLEALTKK